ncbi:MAG: c-type cytochrome domain-containing protein [Planctomycetota bacterium]
MLRSKPIPFRGLCTLVFAIFATPMGMGAPPTWNADIVPLLNRYCVGCHSRQEPEAELQMHSFAALRRGGVSGVAVVPGRPEESLVWRRMSGIDEPRMPPEDSPQPSDDERKIIEAWISAGATGSDLAIPLSERWQFPRSSRVFSGELPITAAAFVGPNEALWLGRPGTIAWQRDDHQRKLDLDVIGKVTQIRSSHDGKWILIASGIPGVGGQTVIVDAESIAGSDPSPRVVRRIEGHQDILYAVAIDPSGSMLATAGYDRVIHLWDFQTGTLLRSLQGHNGAVYDLDFDPSGTVLASASADETIKIWRVDTGERLDTLGQGEAEQYSVRWQGMDGKLMAAGADRRVRVWKLLSKDKPTVSPMLQSVFAHEQPINQLSPSPDGRWVATAGEDRLVKIWSTDSWNLAATLEPLEDIASAVLWNRTGDRLAITTLSGQVLVRDVRSELERVGARASEPSRVSSEGSAITASEPPQNLDELPGKRSPAESQRIPIPSIVSAVISNDDMRGIHAGDWYAFDAKQGDDWIISIDAARNGSPLDSLIDLCDLQGEPLVRTRLQAVRESYFTFRGKDSNSIDDFRLHRWEDMELNQYLYAAGEVVKLWLYPRGPDSGFKVYPGYGNRFTYWDTTASAHALNEPAWTVEEIPEGHEPKSNGLPIFPIYYSNDDDATRRSGKDSRLHFQPPRDGTYLIRVRDARGQSGEDYKYQLRIERPRPRFQFRVDQNEITLRPKVGCEFSVAVERFDGLNGPVDIEFVNLPEGIVDAGRLTVEQTQGRAIGQLRMTDDALAKLGPEIELRLRARASHAGVEIPAESEATLKVKLSDKPAMSLKMIANGESPDAPPLEELRIQRGTTVSATLVIELGELQGDLSFGGDDSGRNLPHGCFVGNIGLNGLLIPAGQSTREVFITASPVVARGERMFHLRALVDGNPTTLPIRLVVE